MEEGEKFLWKSNAAEEHSTMVSVTLGRVMNTLLSARPRKLNDAVSRLSSNPRNNTSAGLSVFHFQNHITEFSQCFFLILFFWVYRLIG